MEIPEQNRKQCLFHRKLSSLSSRKRHPNATLQKKQQIQEERDLVLQIYNAGGCEALSEHYKLLKNNVSTMEKSPRVGEMRQSFLAESVSNTHIFSQTHKKIHREHKLDGSVIETEEHNIQSEEFSVVFKRQYHEACTKYKQRMLQDEELFMQRIISSDGWNKFRDVALKNMPKDASAKGLFAFHTEPLKDCIAKHRRQWEALTEYMKKHKPSVLTLENKAIWLNRCYNRAWRSYPTDIANAFYFLATIYKMAVRLKTVPPKSDCKMWLDVQTPIYCKQETRPTIQTRLVNVMQSDGWCSFSNESLVANPMVAYEMIDAWLPNSKMAGRILQSKNIITFLQHFEYGEYTALYNQLMSVQISMRLILGQVIDKQDFYIRYIEHGPAENQYNSMLYDSCNGYSKFQADYTVWLRASVVYQGMETFDLILLRQIALNLLGDPVKKWHATSLAPTLVDLSTKQIETEEMFMHEDINIPARLMHEKEFRSLLSVKEDRDRKKLEEDKVNAKIAECESKMLQSGSLQKHMIHSNPLGFLTSQIEHMLRC
jgi:hypothetical protein